MTDLQGQAALVTGASRGIGRAIAVPSAGVFPPPAPIGHARAQQWRDCFDVNLFGAVDTARAVVPLLRPGCGRIIVLGSGTGREANPGLGVYGASKAALASFVRTPAIELRDDGITVNELIPGPVATTMLSPDGLRSSLTDAGHEWMKQPEDVTDLALFLARCPTHGPTGQTFNLARRPLH